MLEIVGYFQIILIQWKYKKEIIELSQPESLPESQRFRGVAWNFWQEGLHLKLNHLIDLSLAAKFSEIPTIIQFLIFKKFHIQSKFMFLGSQKVE